jgi:REP element-mobilizing transposase RayT
MFDSGHKALRKGRCSEPGHVYLVTFVTRGRKPLFRDFTLATAACRTFAKSAQAARAEPLCWVLMPDHFHGLIGIGEESNLARCVQRIKGQASAGCRAVMPQHGTLWSRAFHDHALRADEDVAIAAKYVIENPVRAGLVDDEMHYPYWDAFWLKA